MNSTSTDRRGFTLIELMVVIAMIAMIAGAVSTSFSSAQERARVQRATAEVKSATQAILAYENFSNGNKLETMKNLEADASSLSFLLGGETSKNGKVPVLLAAALSSGGKWRDPWGTPYRVTIREGTPSSLLSFKDLKTRYYMPNMYRLSKEERQ